MHTQTHAMPSVNAVAGSVIVGLVLGGALGGALGCSDGESGRAPPVAPARNEMADAGPDPSVLPVVMLDVPNMTPAMFTLFGAKVPGRIRVVESHDGQHREATDLMARPAALESRIAISMRGNSSTSYPLVEWANNATGFHQRSYSIELRNEGNQPQEGALVGMPADADWALVGCWNDKTCMRNALVYRIGQELGRWNPRLRFVEVYFNGDYIGIYQLVEPTRRGSHRVNVPKVADDTTQGDLTGGYIFRREGPGRKSATAMPPVFDWLSPTTAPGPYKTQNVYSYHYPSEDSITPAQRMYLHDYVARFEQLMQAPDWSSAYPTKIDVLSWIDYALVNELSHNIDAYWKSLFFVKEPDARGGRLSVSPLWDYNMGFGNADYREGWKTDRLNIKVMQEFGGECDYQGRMIEGPPMCDVGCCTEACDATKGRCWNMPVVPFYWDNLWKDPPFLDQLKCRWLDLRKGPLRMSFIDARLQEWKAALAPRAMPRHLARWPELLKSVWANPYVVDPTSAPIPGETNAEFFEREVTWMRNWVAARINFLDASLPGTCTR
jgi:hypothetical protein